MISISLLTFISYIHITSKSNLKSSKYYKNALCFIIIKWTEQEKESFLEKKVYQMLFLILYTHSASQSSLQSRKKLTFRIRIIRDESNSEFTREYKGKKGNQEFYDVLMYFSVAKAFCCSKCFVMILDSLSS